MDSDLLNLTKIKKEMIDLVLKLIYNILKPMIGKLIIIMQQMIVMVKQIT